MVITTEIRYEHFKFRSIAPRSDSTCWNICNGSGARQAAPRSRSFILFWCSSVFCWWCDLFSGSSTTAPYRPVLGGCHSLAIYPSSRATYICDSPSWPKSTARYSAFAWVISWSSSSVIIASYAIRFDARTSPADRTPSSSTSSTDMVSVERSRFR